MLNHLDIHSWCLFWQYLWKHDIVNRRNIADISVSSEVAGRWSDRIVWAHKFLRFAFTSHVLYSFSASTVLKQCTVHARLYSSYWTRVTTCPASPLASVGGARDWCWGSDWLRGRAQDGPDARARSLARSSRGSDARGGDVMCLTVWRRRTGSSPHLSGKRALSLTCSVFMMMMMMMMMMRFEHVRFWSNTGAMSLWLFTATSAPDAGFTSAGLTRRLNPKLV